MRLLTNLFFKVTLSSMILTAPAMRTGNTDDGGKSNLFPRKENSEAFYSSVVIRNFVDHPTVKAMRAVMRDESVTGAEVASTSVVPNAGIAGATAGEVAAASAGKERRSTVIAAELPAAGVGLEASKMASKMVELRMVINQASLIYTRMKLDSSGLDEKAFEYAWRGYHNLLKKRLIRRRSVLSICDFSQSSSNKRMYVIDVRHKKLLFRTYVAHGQNSGDEYASSFSNEPDSYKSSLGFYVTQWTYFGHNGLSLKLNGVDSGYNDMAAKRNIVLHGSTYVSDRYMQEFGTLGTSLGCPAIPSTVSGRIIRAVKGGSCLFIYHPTPQYLDNSSIING